MEYDNVTLTAYLSALVVSALLTAVFGYQKLKAQRTGVFVYAAAVHTIHLASITLALAGWFRFPVWLLFFETLHFAVWIYAIHQLLRQFTPDGRLPRSLLILFGLAWPVTLVALLGALINLQVMLALAPWFALVLAVISLASTEQLFRQAAANNRQIKLLCLCLVALFLYDIYLFTHVLIFQEIDSLMWQGRAAVSSAAFLFMALGALLLMQQRDDRPAHFNLSRPVAFYSTSLVAVGFLITMLALGGYYVRLYGGEWGTIVYGFFMVGAVLSIGAVFVSSRIRSNLSVLINKHLFRHKYDYRSEWLRLINFLAQPADSSEVNMRAFYAVAAITRTPGGALWLRKQNRFEPVYQAGLPYHMDLEAESVDSPFCRTLIESEWVFFPDGAEGQALGQYNERLPDWAHRIPKLWLIFPLIVGEELVGFMALTKPLANAELTWEDLDLLKTMGRQLASYLKRHQQAEQLAEGRQFETYNKLVAFIIHDLNNLIAQQALVVRNAERHKHNPEFVDDAIHTISNSVERMNKLLLKLRPSASEVISRISLHGALAEAIDECNDTSGRLSAELNPQPTSLDADQMRLVKTFSHFIKNALEATPDDGRVHVTLDYKEHLAVVKIEDNGSGMDWDFIHNRLFKPFETTKSGKGMGIGVYLSREYISDLRGSLDIASKPGQGTTVTVTLPVIQD
ncbi:XrtA/PEP-CTERM system histidine kinase PrsK [Marinimicrobium alkaliphilum]|uniref:XrtA/PEP-CTERM system histidine kinase PrsK n=1 Tax=Marinimicrobium alkaliphilum TaxID=2202654 RepID=UPI000DB96DF2|nr:XrtA/PEP-CTERM system histidine kinase PrsK [Marinimicrobium alkaliphilum]